MSRKEVARWLAVGVVLTAFWDSFRWAGTMSKPEMAGIYLPLMLALIFLLYTSPSKES